MSAIAHSRLTAQGRISVPAAVRRRPGVAPGAVLEWNEEGGAIVVRRFGRYSSEDVHRALLPKRAPKTKTLDQLKEGIRGTIRPVRLIMLDDAPPTHRGVGRMGRAARARRVGLCTITSLLYPRPQRGARYPR